jgi:hypothetical protein
MIRRTFILTILQFCSVIKTTRNFVIEFFHQIKRRCRKQAALYLACPSLMIRFER